MMRHGSCLCGSITFRFDADATNSAVAADTATAAVVDSRTDALADSAGSTAAPPPAVRQRLSVHEHTSTLSASP